MLRLLPEIKTTHNYGVTIVYEATGMSRSAITQGIAEMAYPEDAAPPDRARMFGGDRKKTGEKYPHYERELEKTFLIHR
jgi:hypothetical protein